MSVIVMCMWGGGGCHTSCFFIFLELSTNLQLSLRAPWTGGLSLHGGREERLHGMTLWVSVIRTSPPS